MPKTLSVISVIVSVILLLFVGAVSMFFLLIALNGFSERASIPGLISSLLCNGLGIILSAVAVWKLPHWFIGKFNWSSTAAVFVSVLVGFFVGGGFSLVSFFIGIVVANSLWNAR